MVTKEMISRWKEIAEDLGFEYEKVCIRVQDTSFELGELNHQSHVWVDGEDTGEELDGVSTLSLEYAGMADSYYGDHVAIVAGNEYSYGEDAGEIIPLDAEVVEILA